MAPCHPHQKLCCTSFCERGHGLICDFLPKKARHVGSGIKRMLIVFFGIRGVGPHEFVREAQTANAQLYCDVLGHLTEDIRREKRELQHKGNWMLRHDNSPTHRAPETCLCFERNNILTLPYPPYSPDLAPCGFLLFANLKLRLNGCRFKTAEAECESKRMFDMV